MEREGGRGRGRERAGGRVGGRAGGRAGGRERGREGERGRGERQLTCFMCAQRFCTSKDKSFASDSFSMVMFMPLLSMTFTVSMVMVNLGP